MNLTNAASERIDKAMGRIAHATSRMAYPEQAIRAALAELESAAFWAGHGVGEKRGTRLTGNGSEGK